MKNKLRIVLIVFVVYGNYCFGQNDFNFDSLYSEADFVAHVKIGNTPIDKCPFICQEAGTNNIIVNFETLKMVKKPTLVKPLNPVIKEDTVNGMKISHIQQNIQYEYPQDQFTFTYGYLPVAPSFIEAGKEYIVFLKGVGYFSGLYLHKNAIFSYNYQLLQKIKKF